MRGGAANSLLIVVCGTSPHDLPPNAGGFLFKTPVAETIYLINYRTKRTNKSG